MAQPFISVVLNGTPFPIPQVGTEAWGQSVTNWIVAACSSTGFTQIASPIAPLTILGNNSALSAAPTALTVAQVNTLLGTVTTGSNASLASLTLSAPLSLGNGGTGQTTANAALNALLPAQATHANNVLVSDGTNTSWTGSPTLASLTVTGSLNQQGANNLNVVGIVASGITNLTTSSSVVIAFTSAGAITAKLPSSGNNGQVITIKDGSGQANTNALTIDRNGGTIDGASSNFIITTPFGYVTLVCSSTNLWYVIGEGP